MVEGVSSEAPPLQEVTHRMHLSQVSSEELREQPLAHLKQGKGGCLVPLQQQPSNRNRQSLGAYLAGYLQRIVRQNRQKGAFLETAPPFRQQPASPIQLRGHYLGPPQQHPKNRIILVGASLVESLRQFPRLVQEHLVVAQPEAVEALMF